MKLIDAALIYHPDTAVHLDSALIIPEIVCSYWDCLLRGNGSICVGWGEFNNAKELEFTYAGAFVFNSGASETVNCIYIKSNLSSEDNKPHYFWLSDPHNNVGASLVHILRGSSSFYSKILTCNYLVWKIR